MQLAVIMSLYKNDTLIYVKGAVDSLLYQTFSEFDLYIQFDGPVQKEVESYINGIQKENVYVLKREINRGLAVSLNELLNVVLDRNYLYIARMDADDICFPYRFQRQVEYMETHPQIDICGGYIEEMDEEEKTMGVIEYPIEHTKMKLFFGRRNPLAHMTVFFRRTYFDKAGYYPIDTNKDEDTMFWLKGFLSGCVFANIDEPLVRVRVNKNFYRRRNGFDKSWGDFRNRCRIIYSLRIPPVNYLFAFGRFLFFLFPISRLTQLAYRYLR